MIRAPSFGSAVVLHDLFVHARGGKRLLADELQFAPQAVEFCSPRLVEQKATQRLVLAVVQEEAPLSISWDDRFEEDCRREEGAKLRSRSSPFVGDARMDDLRDARVARRRFGDRLGQPAAAARRGDQERLHFSRFRTAFVEAHVGAKEPRQLEQLL